MTLHARLVTAVTVLSIVLLGAALSAVWLAVRASRQEQLDTDLRAAAIEEAHEVAIRGGRELSLGVRDEEADDDEPSIAKYGVIYGPDGAALAWTANLHRRVPLFPSIDKPKNTCFDIRLPTENVRGILVDVPPRSGTMLLIGASRVDLDRETSYLARALLTAFAAVVVGTALLAAQIVRKFTRGYEAIAEVTRRVAEGDLSARVETMVGSAELLRQQANMNRMIAQLESLFSSQQRFVAHAAHELRSPLTRLYGELSLALRRVRTAEEYRFTIEQALDATRRLKLLAEDLLALARLDADVEVAWRDVLVGEAISAAEQAMAEDVRQKNVRIDVQVPEAVVRTRRTDLERMFRNLLENAVRHSPEGGFIALSGSTSGGAITIFVADAGPGIADSDRSRIFEPFWRGADQQASGASGTGLGLAIARQIARAHGGDIELADAPERGAVFSVTLPIAASNAHPLSASTWPRHVSASQA